MRQEYSEIIERGRVVDGPYASNPQDRHGVFRLIRPPMRKYLNVIASDGSYWQDAGLPWPVWEHVSVSLPDRCPTWEEMCWVKSLFFEDEECVLQFHPPRKKTRQHPSELLAPVASGRNRHRPSTPGVRVMFNKPNYWLETEDGVRPVSLEEYRQKRPGLNALVVSNHSDYWRYRINIRTYFNGVSHSGHDSLRSEPNALPLVYHTDVWTFRVAADAIETLDTVWTATREAALAAHRQMCLKHLGHEPKEAKP